MHLLWSLSGLLVVLQGTRQPTMLQDKGSSNVLSASMADSMMSVQHQPPAPVMLFRQRLKSKSQGR